MEHPIWLTPLLRALVGALLLAGLAVIARRQFGRRRDPDEPFDSGLD